MSYQQEKFKEIADAIRETTQTTELIKPSDFASKIDKVYEQGVAAGKSEEWHDFWDNLQQCGNRGMYFYTFSGFPINKFFPKYDIILSNSAQGMFRQFGSIYLQDDSVYRYEPIDLAERLNECGVRLDTSGATDIQGMFAFVRGITRIPELDTRNSPSINTAFNSAYSVETVDKVILKDDGSQSFNSSFTSCTSLKNIVFEGVIGQNFDIHWSPLTKESIESIINAASKSASFAITFSLDAVNKAFETSDGANDGSTSDKWAELIATKPNVTISLS